MKKNVYGYVRVSTREQNVERQLIALEKMGIEFQYNEFIKDIKRHKIQLQEKNKRWKWNYTKKQS